MDFKKVLHWDRRKKALKVRKTKTSAWRLGVQGGFTLISVVLGWQFARFVCAAKTTTSGPARLPVSVKPAITSVECIGCTDCVVTCPVPEALIIGMRKRTLNPRRFALAVIAVFLIGYFAARVGGAWESRLTPDEIRHHVAKMYETEYGQPGR